MRATSQSARHIDRQLTDTRTGHHTVIVIRYVNVIHCLQLTLHVTTAHPVAHLLTVEQDPYYKPAAMRSVKPLTVTKPVTLPKTT